jgi:hypothetical protein
MYEYVSKYIEKQEATPNEEPVSYLIQLADEFGFTFENYFRGDTYIYALTINQTGIKDSRYTYAFAIQYDWSGSGVS